MLSTLDQGRKSKRGEIGIRQGLGPEPGSGSHATGRNASQRFSPPTPCSHPAGQGIAALFANQHALQQGRLDGAPRRMMFVLLQLLLCQREHLFAHQRRHRDLNPLRTGPLMTTNVAAREPDAPGGHLNCLHSFMNFTIGGDLTTILVTAEDVHPRIGWVLEHTQYAAVAQPSPYNLAIPRPAVSSLRESQSPFREAMYDCIGAARFAKEAKCHFHRAPHFSIGVRNDAALLVVAITDRERETQLAFFRFVELTALEAHVQKMQLGLSHGPLQPEQEAVVEIRRIV